MASKITVAENIRKLALLYQSMVEAADVLEAVGKKEQVLAECEAATEKARAELADLEERIAQSMAKAAEAGRQVEAQAAMTAALAAETIRRAEEEAKTKANGIVDEAGLRAGFILTDAVQGAREKKATLERELSVISGQIDAAREEMTRLNEGNVALRNEHAELVSKIGDAKAQIQKLLG
jgi:predicted  nucleic acid-binding Zn-ribbon protein